MNNFTKLKFQVLVFGDFSSIDATSENVTKLMKIMNSYDMLPNTFKEIEIESNGQQIKSDRIGFSNMKNGFNILFGVKRIDITNHIVGFADDNMYDIDIFIKNIKEIFTKILLDFPLLPRYNRLGFICEFFANKGNEEKENIYKKLIHNFTDSSPVEWTLKQNNVLRLESLNQDINCISYIERVQGKIVLDDNEKEIDDIKVQFDMNTKNETINKFRNEELTFFLDEILNLYNQNIIKIKELFNEVK